jgi:hypothetical protein
MAGIGLRIDHAETFMAAFGADDADGIAVGKEAGAAGDHLRSGGEPADFNVLREAPPGADLGQRHPGQIIATRIDAEDVGESLAQQHGRLRQRQRRTLPEVELAAREHAGAQRLAGLGRQVDIDDAVARPRVDGRRHGAHGAGHGGAVRGFQPGRLAGLQAGQLAGRDLGAPFQPAAADQAEKLLARLGQRADRRAARRDDAVVGRHDAGLGAPQLGRLQAGPGRVQAGQRGVGGGLRLDPLLRAVEALFAQLAGAFVDRPRLGQCRFGFGDRRLALGQFAVDRVAGDARQHVALLHRIADVGVHLGDPVVADFRADDGLLPGGDIAAGRQRLRPVSQLRGGGGDGQGRLGLGGGRGRLVPAGGEGERNQAGEEPACLLRLR